jgi:hypothetical protein
MRDSIVVSLLVVAFATLLTAHVTLVVGLARRRPRWRALTGFFIAPLAPWWGWQEGLRARAVLWVVAAVAYGVARAFASS